MTNAYIDPDLDQWSPAYTSGMAGASPAAADNKQLVAMDQTPRTGACGRECGACPSAGAGCTGEGADQVGGAPGYDITVFGGTWHASRILLNGKRVSGIGPNLEAAIADLEANWRMA